MEVCIYPFRTKSIILTRNFNINNLRNPASIDIILLGTVILALISVMPWF